MRLQSLTPSRQKRTDGVGGSNKQTQKETKTNNILVAERSGTAKTDRDAEGGMDVCFGWGRRAAYGGGT